MWGIMGQRGASASTIFKNVVLPLKFVVILARPDEVLEAHAQNAEHEKECERHAENAGD